MPITGRKLSECFQRFETHLGELVAATVTTKYHLARVSRRGKTLMAISFRQNGPVAIPIETRYGRLFFYLGQLLEAVQEEDGKYRLRTVEYWYGIQESADMKAESLMRWEYVSDAPKDGFCRHHVQVPAKLTAPDGRLDLNKIHLPTGWVTIEEVIRFLIVDLGVKPPCGDEWCGKLEASERKFFEEFTGKRYRTPAEARKN